MIYSRIGNLDGWLYRHLIQFDSTEMSNIEDINQRIMGDGYFVMTMLVDIKDTPISMDKITKELEKIGHDLEVKVQLQHENIFKMMHRV